MDTLQPRILVLAGSNRTGSLNRLLAHAAAEGLRRKGADVVEVDLREHRLPLYDGDLEGLEGVPPAARALHALLRTSHGVFVASPEYNANLSPLLKNTIDWVSRVPDNGGMRAAFGGPVFAVGSASPGGLGGYRGLMLLRQTLELGLGARVLPEMMALGKAHEAFDEEGGLRSEPHAQLLDKVLEALVAATGRAA